LGFPGDFSASIMQLLGKELLLRAHLMCMISTAILFKTRQTKCIGTKGRIAQPWMLGLGGYLEVALLFCPLAFYVQISQTPGFLSAGEKCRRINSISPLSCPQPVTNKSCCINPLALPLEFDNFKAPVLTASWFSSGFS
jgi:hypothetical protein